MEFNLESERFQIDVITTLFPTATRTKVVEREVSGSNGQEVDSPFGQKLM